MKLLGRAFVWFCIASILAQICIVSLSLFKGNLSRKSFVQIVALMNGIDIPGERLKNAIAEGQDIPVPTLEEILDAKVRANLEIDGREQSLERFQQQLLAQQTRQEIENRELEKRRRDLDEAERVFKQGVQSETLGEVQKILEVLPPEQAKNQIMKMLQAGQMSDVVTIVKALSSDKRKKILTEFTEGDEPVKLNEILQALRTAEPMPVSTPNSANEPKDSST
jgi:hypothetical protein